MRRRTLVSLAIASIVAAAAAVALLQSQAPAPQVSMARLLPAGAMLALEARDLASLVADWNRSPERSAWLASENRQAFERSRLFIRLQEAQKEFATAGGAPPGMALLSDVAGSQSILGLYDIGDLELLYVTRLPAARAVENALWRARGNYQPRESAGTRFFVRTDPESKRVVAMGVRDDYLVLATREDLLAGALARIAAPSPTSVATEAWFTRSIGATGAPGDLRLVMNLAALVKTPHFRSYWIQDNVTDVAQYSSGVSDIVRTADGLREERVLLRAAEQPAADEAAGAIGRMLRLVPDEAGLYRAWAAPSASEAKALVLKKIIAPGPGSAIRDLTAPRVAPGNGLTGDGSDLETRIDEEIRAPGPARYQSAALDALVDPAALTALLHLERTRTGGDDVFVGRESVIVLERSIDWPPGAAAAALQQVVAPVLSRSNIGLRWLDAGDGGQRFSRLDGLEPLAVAERGRLLFIANDPALLGLALRAVARPETAVRATFAAGFRHAIERDRFETMMGYIDHAGSPGGTLQPPFFSGNLASLSRTLGRFSNASIAVRDNGTTVSQTVTYGMTR